MQQYIILYELIWEKALYIAAKLADTIFILERNFFLNNCMAFYMLLKIRNKIKCISKSL